MYFQTIDEKQECIGVYKDGNLFFDEMPEDLLRTWRYSGNLSSGDVEFAWIYCGGLDLKTACSEELRDEYDRSANKMRAYRKSFELAKIDLHEHCFFDLVPHDFIVQFLEVKNKITKHVFENYDRVENYDHLARVHKLLHKIKYQNLKINTEDCREIFLKTSLRNEAKKYTNRQNYIDYNLFGTVTGRLTTNPNSFPVLTARRELRKLIKPKNDWFLSLDYNGAEIRTLLALSGEEQPVIDIHTWNLTNVLKRVDLPREEAKTIFFAWLYNPESKVINTQHYDRKKVLDEWYDGEYIRTPMGRQIKVDERRAFNYIIQSTTADLVLERACALDDFLSGYKSFISHIVHDEIVVDLSNDERHLVPEIREIFSQSQLGKYLVNLNAGTNYLELDELRI